MHQSRINTIRIWKTGCDKTQHHLCGNQWQQFLYKEKYKTWPPPVNTYGQTVNPYETEVFYCAHHQLHKLTAPTTTATAPTSPLSFDIPLANELIGSTPQADGVQVIHQAAENEDNGEDSDGSGESSD